MSLNLNSFTGPPTPANVAAWISNCEDKFDNYEFIQAKLLPASFRIREAGTSITYEEGQIWWQSQRTTLLAGTWTNFVKAFKGRFVPEGHEMLQWSAFYECFQQNRSISEYATELQTIRSNLPAAEITDKRFRIHLLFHAHPILKHRVCASGLNRQNLYRLIYRPVVSSLGCNHCRMS